VEALGCVECEKLLSFGPLDGASAKTLRSLWPANLAYLTERERWNMFATAVLETRPPRGSSLLPTIASSLSEPRLFTGSEVLDKSLLRGIGLPVGSGHLIEVAGEAGTGKTQWALQLTTSCVLNLEAPVIFICSERNFPSDRLCEIAMERGGVKGDLDRETALQDTLLGSVVVESVRCVSEAMALFESRLEWLVRQIHPRLIMVDSIAGVFRYDMDDIKARAPLLLRVARCLKRVGSLFDVGVVVLNHARDQFSPSQTTFLPYDNAPPSSRMGRGPSAFTKQVHSPSLGMVWSQCVGTRILLMKHPATSKRRAQVLFSSYLPESSAEFVITSNGVEGIEQ